VWNGFMLDGVGVFVVFGVVVVLVMYYLMGECGFG